MAIFTESTRLIWPAPTASVRSAALKTIVLDFTCAQTRQANRSAVHSSAVGCRLVTTRGKVPRRPRLGASVTRSGSCTSMPPRNDRISLRFLSHDRLVGLREVRRDDAQVRLCRQDGARIVGDARRDDRFDEGRRQGARGVGVDRAVEPDDPAEGGKRIDLARANVGLLERVPVATPHGLVCLMTTPVGSLNSSTRRSAASRSSRLVKESSLP